MTKILWEHANYTDNQWGFHIPFYSTSAGMGERGKDLFKKIIIKAT